MYVNVAKFREVHSQLDQRRPCSGLDPLGNHELGTHQHLILSHLSTNPRDIDSTLGPARSVRSQDPATSVEFININVNMSLLQNPHGSLLFQRRNTHTHTLGHPVWVSNRLPSPLLVDLQPGHPDRMMQVHTKHDSCTNDVDLDIRRGGAQRAVAPWVFAKTQGSASCDRRHAVKPPASSCNIVPLFFLWCINFIRGCVVFIGRSPGPMARMTCFLLPGRTGRYPYVNTRRSPLLQAGFTWLPIIRNKTK